VRTFSYLYLLLTEFSSLKQQRDEDESSVATDYQDFDPSRHNPVFYGKMFSRVPTDTQASQNVDVAQSHPSVIGYAFTEKPAKSPPPPPTPAPEKDQCKYTLYYTEQVTKPSSVLYSYLFTYFFTTYIVHCT